MKRQKITLIILSLCLLLTGCGAKYTTTEDAYVPEEDYQFQYDYGLGSELAESETGYYFLIGNYIHYMDKETLHPMVLCQKPSCLHDKEEDPYIVADCNAFVRADWIGYYNGKVYTIAENLSSSGADLIEIYLDGTGRKLLYHFDIAPTNAALHRGYLYFSSKAYREDGTSVTALQAFSILSSKHKVETVYMSNMSGSDIFGISGYGNHIFFVESGIQNGEAIRNEIRWNCLTDDITVWENHIEQDGVEYFSTVLGYYDGKLFEFWSTPSGDDYIMYYWYYDPITGERERCIGLPDQSYPARYTDGVYFYHYDTRVNSPIEMYDIGGNLLAQVDMDSRAQMILPGNEHLFVIDSLKTFITAYRKSDLASGIVDPIQVLDVNINDYLKSVITTID